MITIKLYIYRGTRFNLVSSFKVQKTRQKIYLVAAAAAAAFSSSKSSSFSSSSKFSILINTNNTTKQNQVFLIQVKTCRFQLPFCKQERPTSSSSSSSEFSSSSSSSSSLGWSFTAGFCLGTGGYFGFHGLKVIHNFQLLFKCMKNTFNF